MTRVKANISHIGKESGQDYTNASAIEMPNDNGLNLNSNRVLDTFGA